MTERRRAFRGLCSVMGMLPLSIARPCGQARAAFAPTQASDDLSRRFGLACGHVLVAQSQDFQKRQCFLGIRKRGNVRELSAMKILFSGSTNDRRQARHSIPTGHLGSLNPVGLLIT